jgi:hypothetical protein
MKFRELLALALVSSALFAACYDQTKGPDALDQSAQNESGDSRDEASGGATSTPSGAPGTPGRPRDRDASASGTDAGPADPNAPPPPPAPTFTEVYETVIAGSCVLYCHGNSHGTGLAMGDRSLAYQNLVGVKAGVGGSAKTCDDGARTRVVPGDAASSLVIQKLRHINDCGDPMPPKGGMLPASKIELFEDWINGGAIDD